MYRFIDVMSDYSERVPYPIPEYPIYACHSRMSVFFNLHCAHHWHDDLEFIVVQSGHMSYSVNGEVITLETGQGIFVNSRQLHNNYSSDGTDCEYVCVLIHPSLLCANAYIEQNYTAPITSNGAFMYTILDCGTPWQRETMETICALQRVFLNSEEPVGLTIQSLSYRIAALLNTNMPDPSGASAQVDQRLATLRRMVGFVQRHYDEAITLQDISTAGSASKSTCCTLFQRHLRQTPIGYLTRYRLEKSEDLLKNPDLSITEIALAVGFSTPSYFTEIFRKHLGLTPTDYRKRSTTILNNPPPPPPTQPPS